MQLSTLLAAALALVAAEAKIAFTKVPGSSVTVGTSFTLEWDGAEDDAPVTITLKQGDPNDLTTVSLLTGNATGGSYSWTPSSDLVDGDNYALEISQGTGFDESNYSGEFSVTGGQASSSSGSMSATGSASASGSMTVTMTSGNSTFVTSYSMYPAATGSGSPSTTGGNGTYTRSTKAPSASTGGIVVTATSTQAQTVTQAQTSAPAASTSNAAAHYGPIGGAAAALFGLAALL
jgi:hypothetical protein